MAVDLAEVEGCAVAEAEGVFRVEGAALPPYALDAVGPWVAVPEPAPVPAPWPVPTLAPAPVPSAGPPGTTGEEVGPAAGELLVDGANDAPPLSTTLGACGDRLPVAPGAAGPTGR